MKQIWAFIFHLDCLVLFLQTENLMNINKKQI